jgi:tetratricopeptide (TPR) repeat protein
VLELDSVKTEDREAAIRLLAQSDHPSAREVLMAALRHPILHVRWAAVYYGINKDPETARECLSGVPELFRLGGHDANLRERVVQAAFQMEPSDALSEFIDKICSEPEQFAEFAQAFGNYATVFFSQEKWDEVIQTYSVAILLSPDNGDYYRDRSRAYLRLNREGEAGKDLDKALEYGAEIPQWVALEYTRWGDVESSMKAVLGSVNPSESRLQQAEALSNLGLYCIRAEQWQKAFDHTNKVLEMSDEVRWNWAIRVIAAHHLGLSAEEERARQEWRKRKSEFDIKVLRPFIGNELTLLEE